VYLYANNKLSEREIKIIPFPNASKKDKIPWDNFNPRDKKP